MCWWWVETCWGSEGQRGVMETALWGQEPLLKAQHWSCGFICSFLVVPEKSPLSQNKMMVFQASVDRRPFGGPILVTGGPEDGAAWRDPGKDTGTRSGVHSGQDLCLVGLQPPSPKVKWLSKWQHTSLGGPFWCYIPHGHSKKPEALGPLRCPGLRARFVDPSERLSWDICAVARRRTPTEAPPPLWKQQQQCNSFHLNRGSGLGKERCKFPNRISSLCSSL